MSLQKNASLSNFPYQNGIKIIKAFEGCKLKAYLCPARVWTIGYGNVIIINGKVANEKTHQSFQDLPDEYKFVTIDQADDLLKKDLLVRIGYLRKLINKELSDNQFGAILSFAYNIGIGGFKRSALRRYINFYNVNEYLNIYELFKNAFMSWISAGGVKLRGLIRRREAEFDLFFKDYTYN